MAERCFIKKESNPPTCGVHDVPLARKELPDEMVATGYKPVTFFVCKVTGAVLNDEARK
jgi:hypothetical protein